MSKLTSLMIMAATLLLSACAQAHFVWLERDGDGPARAYFANGSTISAKKPAGCSTDSKRRA